MSDDKVTTKWMLSEMFSRWSDKTWFQVLACVIVIYLLAAPVAGPIIYKYVNQEAVAQQAKDDEEKHKATYTRSREIYASVRNMMKDYLPRIDCEYMFLLEYHNGAENVVTGIQFCRFDISVEVSSDSVPYVPLDKFKDDIVARYDILMSDELAESGIFCTREEFTKKDKYLAYQLQYIDACSYAMININDMSGKTFASLLCVSTNENINRGELYRCRDAIWRLMVVDFNKKQNI